MDTLESIQNNALIYHSYIAYFLLFSTIIGLGIVEPTYLTTFNYWLKIYISLYLIYRFNIFRTIKFTDLDRRVVFSSGILLLSTTALDEIFVSYASSIRKILPSLSSVF